MKRFCFLTVFINLLITSLPIQGTTQTLFGRIVDGETQRPLAGANIVAEGVRIGVSSDADGHFSLSIGSLPETITISYVGYEAKQVEVTFSDQSLLIELQPVDATLRQITVTAYEGERRLLETAGSVSAVSFEEIRRTDRMRISDLLNRIPGVQADQSDLSETRISIRGAGFRAPFGVRNLRVYLNDIPVTEADGFTRIEAIDLQNIGRIEAIRGPASSMYGAGLGGVLRFETARSPVGTSVNARTSSGSFGLQSNTLSLSKHTPGSGIRITGGLQRYDGYRAHSADDRLFLTATGSFYSDRSTLSFLASVSDQQTEIPGALNEQEYLEDPRLPDPRAQELDTARDQRWTKLGISHRFRFSEHLEQRTSFYGSFYELDHPLAFAYIRNGQQNFGGRTVTDISHELLERPVRHKLGGEAMYQFTVGRRYANNGGDAGNILSDLETSVIQWSAFVQSEADLTPRLTAVAGLSINRFRYDVLDLLQDDRVDQTGVKRFDLAVSPRVALLYLLTDNWSVHGGLSFGFSPPVTNEIFLSDGSVNSAIEAERGINYEIGTRGTFFDQRLSVDLTGYLMTIEDELIPRSVGPGQTIYENAGQTTHRGLELAANGILLDRNSGVIHQIRPAITYSYSNHVFDTFVADGADVAGKKLTGVAPHTVNATFDLVAAGGFFINGSFDVVDRRPLTDDNREFADSYTVLNVRGGIERPVGSLLRVNASVSVNNIFDEVYAPRLALNASSFGGAPPRYYNSAPGRNLLFTLELSWNQN